ncbi:hypothetical protein TcWFU_005053 [Taenia crassiceps]|uniref:Uncharacterized protein n=1 Tax=Taenia crassiceps TaxID=6207 RepID=A0ABR4QDM0_9CEST
MIVEERPILATAVGTRGIAYEAEGAVEIDCTAVGKLQQPITSVRVRVSGARMLFSICKPMNRDQTPFDPYLNPECCVCVCFWKEWQ